MPFIDVLPSEAKLLELALRLKEKKIKRATRLIEQAEVEIEEAIQSIIERTEIAPASLRGTPRLLRDADGRPAKLVWRDVVKSGANSAATPSETTAAKT